MVTTPKAYHILYFGTPEGIVSECEICGPLGLSKDKDAAFAAGAQHLTEAHNCYTTYEETP